MPSFWLMTAIWLLTLVLSAFMVHRSIVYAHSRGMLDQPGQRRSHSTPTARGGGIGIVLACLVCLPLALRTFPTPWPWLLVAALGLALALVAAIGWLDDHRPLRVIPRLAVQLLATGVFALGLLHGGGLIWLPILMLAGAWSINLHNFMDGIDGLLAQQAIFTGTALGLLAAGRGQLSLAAGCGCVATASLGFWFYNRSPARIFMGDVGSGALGLLIFALVALCWRIDPRLLWPALILCSSFVADASLTLLIRLLRGRRWYNAHREHLYQWLVRSGRTHAQVARLYLSWNVLVASPVACLALAWLDDAFIICVLYYLMVCGLWLIMKRRCVRRDLLKARHEST